MASLVAPRMPNSLRALIERMLPWYQSDLEQERNAKSARVARQSEAARLRAERVIEQYRRASAASRDAGEQLSDEARK